MTLFAFYLNFKFIPFYFSKKYPSCGKASEGQTQIKMLPSSRSSSSLQGLQEHGSVPLLDYENPSSSLSEETQSEISNLFKVLFLYVFFGCVCVLFFICFFFSHSLSFFLFHYLFFPLLLPSLPATKVLLFTKSLKRKTSFFLLFF